MGEPKLDAHQKYTPEEYLTLEAESQEKWEFFDGQITAMSGGTRNHAVISLNAGIALGNGLRDRDCTPFGSELKVYAEAANAYLYPDAMVVCGAEQLQAGRNDVLMNPTLIVEVLSPSTMQYDFVKKYDRYKRMPSLREYVLISQDQPRVEVRSSVDDWGQIRTYEGLDSVAIFSSLSLQIPLTELYRRVTFEG
ncbi:MAG TPA: hypothetical protein DCE41_23375 [Cytophagales bacterium]|nr:hypothetical protein [Cytophagales bacterium]HAP62299.1 hypothetical protein [Cytophagales bacterium]